MAPSDSHPETRPRPPSTDQVMHLSTRDPDYCERCQLYDELVACIGPDGALLAMICEDCAKEYLASGLDDL